MIYKKPFIIVSALFIYINITIPFNASAGLGMHGAKVVSSSSVILNEFTTLTVNGVTGATSITVASSSLNANGRFSGSMGAGELVMIIQMQGATLNSTVTSSSWGSITSYNNAGNFEFDEVASVPDGTHITLVSALKNSYTASGNVQVIRVPRYTTFTVNLGDTVSTQAWNGSTGGVIAIEVNGNSTINGVINASGLGFVGGELYSTASVDQSYEGSNYSAYASTSAASGGALKGEGIGGDTTTYRLLFGGSYGRGAPANGGGGGNNHNAGGGGGSNANNGVAYNGFGYPDTITGGSSWITAWDLDSAIYPVKFHLNTSSGGGRGGYSYANPKNSTPTPQTYAPRDALWKADYRSNVGGLGGHPLDNNSGARLFMGGGGGAGDANDGYGSGGGNGGGIVYLLAGDSVSGGGIINANGADAAASVGKDAAGGGGGGGSVVIYTNSAPLKGLTINANGGKGGDQTWSSTRECEGPGGGGGAGYLALSTPNTFSTSALGAKNGTTATTQMSTFTPNGATMGASGLITVPINPYTGIVDLPITLLNFSGTEENSINILNWVTSAEINNNYFTLQRSVDGKNYSFLAKIAGAGNSTSTHVYQFTDDSPLKSYNYYLLSQTDFNGTTVTFDPILLNNKAQPGTSYILSAAPIPFDDNVKIDYYSRNGGAIDMNIINITGQVIKNESMESVEGINSFVLDNLSNFAAGIYFLRITAGDTNLSLKMIKN